MKEIKKKEKLKPIKKQFYLSEKENRMFLRKVAKVGFPQSSVIRILIKGMWPKENRPVDYLKFFEEFFKFNNNLEYLLRRKDILSYEDKKYLREQQSQWCKAMTEIQGSFCPEKFNMVEYINEHKEDGQYEN